MPLVISSLVTLGAHTHAHVHTHTQSLIVRTCIILKCHIYLKLVASWEFVSVLLLQIFLAVFTILRYLVNIYKEMWTAPIRK